MSDVDPCAAVLYFVFAGVFVLIQVYAFLQYLKDKLTRQEFQTLFFLGVALAAGVVFLSVIYLTYTGQFTFTVIFMCSLNNALPLLLTLLYHSQHSI